MDQWLMVEHYPTPPSPPDHNSKFPKMNSLLENLPSSSNETLFLPPSIAQAIKEQQHHHSSDLSVNTNNTTNNSSMQSPKHKDAPVSPQTPDPRAASSLDEIPFQERMRYNSEKNMLILHLKGLHIKNSNDVAMIQSNLTSKITEIGRKVNVLVNYDFVTIDDSALHSYLDMCEFMTKNFYNHIARYTTTSFLQIQKFGKELEKRNFHRTSSLNLFDESDHNENIIITKNNSYLIEKQVGEGTYGQVKLAISANNGNKVAIKMMNKNDIECLGITEFVEREAQILKLVHHKFIANLVEIHESNESYHFIVEYAGGGTLQDYLEKNKKMSESFARNIFKMILEALSYLHSKFIVHRDLQLSNIMLDENGCIKIIDFGASDFYDPSYPSLKLLCGNSSYMAPEMFFQKPYIGPEVDTWSLGVVLFYLVNGYLPFRYSSYIMMGEYSSPPDEKLSSEIRDLLKKIMTVDPEKRYTISDILEHPWMKIQD